MPLQGETPASDDVMDVLWPTGMITGSVLGEADMAPHFLPCDGRRVSQATYPALYAKLAHRFEVSPGVNPGDGLFRLPPMMEVGANSSLARIPAGLDPASADTVGTLAGQLAHTHGGGTLSMPVHTHAVGTLAVPSHAHSGAALVSAHYHTLYNDTQPFEDFNDSLVTGTFESLGAGAFGANNPYYLVNAVNPGLGGAISGSGSLAATGAPGNNAGATAVTGSSGASDPAYLTLNWYVKR